MNHYDSDQFMKLVYRHVDPSNFYGDVLYLGMGSLWLARNHSDKVKSTTIIEIDKKTIEYYSKNKKESWEIINEDAWSYTPTIKYDIIFADIWERAYCYKELQKMFDRYKNHVKPGGSIKCLESLVRVNTIPENGELKYKNN